MKNDSPTAVFGWRHGAFVCAVFLTSPTFAQQTGLVTGQVNNASTKLFLEGARVEGPGGRVVFTDRDGEYEISLPAGPATLQFSYTGLTGEMISLQVRAGDRAVQNVQLTSAIYQLEKMTVSSVREGRALAITRQQQAPNLKNIASTDAFGNIADGNPGDLLQQLPGVTAVYNGQDVRSVQIRGIDASLNSVSMDGFQMAVSNSAGGSTQGMGRAYEFEQASLGLIETIELTKAPTPDMPASSIGGNVNMVTKSAFDRAVKRYFTYQFGGVHRTKFFTRSDSWWREPIPNIGPSMNFTYADRLGEGEKVGVLLTSTFHSQPGADVASIMAYQNIGAGPAYINSINVPRPAGAPRTRVAFGGKVDYKLSERTILTLNTSYNWFHETNDTRALALATGAAVANFRPGFTSTLQEVLPNAASSATMTLSTDDISGATIVVAPSGRFKTPGWDISYGASYSTAGKYYDYYPEGRHFKSGRPKAQVVAALRQNLGYIIDRSQSLEFPKITQTAGRDLYDLSNYAAGVQVTYLDKGVEDDVFSGRFNARRNLRLAVPVWVKVGLDYQQEYRRTFNHSRRFNRLGPDGVNGTADDHLGAFLDTTNKFSDTNLGYRKPPWANPFAVARDVTENPRLWSEDLAFRTNTHLLQDRKITEKITAGYAMGHVQLGNLAVLGGLRVERTETDAEGPLSTGTPSVVTGRKSAQGDYQSAFPGVHLKYTPRRGVVLRGSYATSIGRPSFDNLIPFDNVNEGAQTVTISNASLRPQFADSFDLGMEYYFEPVGLISASVFLKEVRDFQFADSSQVVGAGTNNGYGGLYQGYGIRVVANGGKARYRGFELAYQQQLTFLPGFWKGFGLSLNFTKLETQGDYGGTTSTTAVAGFIPETANAAISYALNKFDLRLNAVWRGEYLVTNAAVANQLVFQQPKIQANLKMVYHHSVRLGFFWDLENINRSPITETYRGYTDRPVQTRISSAKMTAGVRGRF
ncbi:MAG: TonB-dependent receptor [Opitutus sp.]|nr:TonB-dependent receptor [Opitutus sp.]